jgi:putative ABC transport system ATP-binding protein
MSSPPPSVPRIETRNLTRRLPSGERTLTILAGVDLAIPAAEMMAVLGPSGSGKSTLLALLAGLDRPSEGEVLLDGVALSGLSEDRLALLRRRKVGFVFQSFQLLGHLTAADNVALPLELLGRPHPRRRATELLGRVGLGERAHHYPVQLSGGEQQRVALARAFAAEPPILLADEPTGNLDRATGERVLAILRELHEEAGTTSVLVTHDPEVAALADRRIYLRDGRVQRIEGHGVAARHTDSPAAAAHAGAGDEAAASAARAGSR